MELARYRADLHVHTCLSPCGELEMSPARIAGKAAEVGLDLIAICDHNSAENTDAVMRACAARGLAAIAGIEISSREEIHLIGLFPNVQAAEAAQKVIFEHLPGENYEDVFGPQIIASHDDYVEGYNNRLLIGATTLSIEQVVDLIHENSGLAIAAHVDRASYSLISQLGFVPRELALDAIEISATAAECGEVPQGCEGFPVVTGSDAHRLAEIGSVRTTLMAAEASFEELGLALRHEDGRAVAINGD